MATDFVNKLSKQKNLDNDLPGCLSSYFNK